MVVIKLPNINNIEIAEDINMNVEANTDMESKAAYDMYVLKCKEYLNAFNEYCAAKDKFKEALENTVKTKTTKIQEKDIIYQLKVDTTYKEIKHRHARQDLVHFLADNGLYDTLDINFATICRVVYRPRRIENETDS